MGATWLQLATGELIQCRNRLKDVVDNADKLFTRAGQDLLFSSQDVYVKLYYEVRESYILIDKLLTRAKDLNAEVRRVFDDTEEKDDSLRELSIGYILELEAEEARAKLHVALIKIRQKYRPAYEDSC